MMTRFQEARWGAPVLWNQAQAKPLGGSTPMDCVDDMDSMDDLARPD
jgi:hypothetical protein